MLYYPWTVALDPRAQAIWLGNPGPGFMYLNGECFVIRQAYETTLLASTEFNLTVPRLDFLEAGRAAL